ncbi:MAG TPA: hypothetical protein VGI74_14840, partial [Streptosporangiaceae bacterium]
MPASSRTDKEPAETDSDPRPAPEPVAANLASANPRPAADPVARSEAADPVIGAERDHLARSRRFLRLMREDVLSLNALGGDPVSEEYLKADLYRRAEALVDLPDTPLFFG